ncbi:hypothetical protein U1Q18_044089, partial [Sarracenia purpurea var. burkii]
VDELAIISQADESTPETPHLKPSCQPIQADEVAKQSLLVLALGNPRARCTTPVVVPSLSQSNVRGLVSNILGEKFTALDNTNDRIEAFSNQDYCDGSSIKESHKKGKVSFKGLDNE